MLSRTRSGFLRRSDDHSLRRRGGFRPRRRIPGTMQGRTVEFMADVNSDGSFELPNQTSEGTNWNLTDLEVSGNVDPFTNLNFAVTNNAAVTLLFTVSVTLPIVPQLPATLHGGSTGGTLTDSNLQRLGDRRHQRRHSVLSRSDRRRDGAQYLSRSLLAERRLPGPNRQFAGAEPRPAGTNAAERARLEHDRNYQSIHTHAGRFVLWQQLLRGGSCPRAQHAGLAGDGVRGSRRPATLSAL